MIYEVRIFSRIGSSIYAAKFDISQNKITTTEIERASLFSSMMSAILSFDSEVGRSEIREFIYEENKAVLHFLENIGFLVFADKKVRNRDLEQFLANIAKKWLKHFEDKEYLYLSDSDLQKISKLVDRAIDDIFWWIKKYPTPSHLWHIGTRTLFQPGSTYFARYLSNYYHILSFLLPLLVTLLSLQLEVKLSGFSTTRVTDANLLAISVPVLIFWLAPGFFLKAAFGDKFNLRAYYTVSGLQNFYLTFLVLISSNWYATDIAGPVLQISGIFSGFIRIFLILAPANLSFFGYFILTGYSSSFTNDIRQSVYLTAYTLVVVFLVSLTSIISI